MHSIKYFLIFLFFCSSCVKKDDSQLHVSFHQIDIPIEREQLPFYIHHYFSPHGDIAVGHDKGQQKFDFFDLNKGKFLKSVPYETEGPKGLPDIREFFFLNGQLFILSLYHLYVYGYNNDIYKKIYAKQDIAYFENNNMTIRPEQVNFYNTQITRPCFHMQKSKLYHVAYSEGITNLDAAYYEEASIVEIDLNTFETRPLAKLYEQSGLSKQQNVGYMSGYNLSLSAGEDSVLFTLHALSDIFVLDLKTNQLSKIAAEPLKYNPYIPLSKLSPSNDPQKYINSLFQSGQYLQISYDPYRKLYYRVHQMPNEDINDKFLKSNVISVFNRDFELIQEFPIEASVYPDFVVREDGLIFRTSPQDTESYLSYTLVKIEKE
ncbi:MAG: DUF4221 domain-containing protein [Cyclobacteriaceae bacterium]|nr:DUF4221 family protein [Cyclobacteriaceae bacterium]MCH8517887.1 DUF4221 domain-containing protein [Cyclobacteriaceae bacterium]